MTSPVLFPYIFFSIKAGWETSNLQSDGRDRLREWWIWDKEEEPRTNKRAVLPRVFISCRKSFLQLMKPLGETSLLFVLCSSSSCHIHHSLNLLVSHKHNNYVVINNNVVGDGSEGLVPAELFFFFFYAAVLRAIAQNLHVPCFIDQGDASACRQPFR